MCKGWCAPHIKLAVLASGYYALTYRAIAPIRKPYLAIVQPVQNLSFSQQLSSLPSVLLLEFQSDVNQVPLEHHPVHHKSIVFF